MDIRPTWRDTDESGAYVVPNVLSLSDLVSRPENMDETVPHTLVFPVSLITTGHPKVNRLIRF